MSGFNAEQVAQLLKPIAAQRVLKDGKNNSHVSQQDVTAHLTRVFGFGGWDTEILSWEPIFETPRIDNAGKETGRWDVAYRASLRLTVRDERGIEVCHYEDGATHTAQNQSRGDAHDLAAKSCLSLALKRCAKNLGDQFGLSLYNKGQMTGLVLGTLVGADDNKGGRVSPESLTSDRDVQDGVEQQHTLGNDETDYDPWSTGAAS